MTPLGRSLRSTAAAATGVIAVALFSGCATTVSMQPGPDANAPECAAVTVRLPASVDGQSRNWTDAQATGAWGDPVSVLLTCGVELPGPSTLCESVDGVDWLIDDSEAPRYRFTTYGRVPAVEVYLDYDVVSGRSVLGSLSSAVNSLPATGDRCTDRAEG